MTVFRLPLRQDEFRRETLHDADGEFVVDFSLTEDAAEVMRAVNAHAELVAALEAYRSARAMPKLGDYSTIQWQNQQGPTNPDWHGGDCAKHGRWYGMCHSCAEDWRQLAKKADHEANIARDKAPLDADNLALAALTKVKP